MKNYVEEVSQVIGRIRDILGTPWGTDYSTLALNMIDAAKTGNLDLEKLLSFEETDFFHDTQILMNWDRKTHKCKDEHALLRSYPAVQEFKFMNHYECPGCRGMWWEKALCIEDDICPTCGRLNSPVRSDYI